MWVTFCTGAIFCTPVYLYKMNWNFYLMNLILLNRNEKGMNTSNKNTENIQDLIANELSIFTLNNNESNDSQMNSVDKLKADSFENVSPRNSRIVEELIKRLGNFILTIL